MPGAPANHASDDGGPYRPTQRGMGAAVGHVEPAFPLRPVPQRGAGRAGEGGWWGPGLDPQGVRENFAQLARGPAPGLSARKTPRKTRAERGWPRWAAGHDLSSSWYSTEKST